MSPPSKQPEGRIEYDGARYRYHGFILTDGVFVPKHCAFTPDEAGVLPGCDPDRVRAMLDCVGRDAKRQEEIRRFGMLAWHSPYRPESAAEQALDYIFRHD
nr:hypothetical protein [Ktedonobacterales bacterium]